MNKRVAIQGFSGAFHEVASRHYFENEEIDIICCDTFIELINNVENKKADVGIMAIENSVAGSILQNYALLRDSKLSVTGEIYLRIEQNLMVLPGQKIEDITEVYSHPMAILQCRKFFQQYPYIKLIESIDTALSARDIYENKKTGIGAIASSLASKMYDLEIIAKGIETNKRNYTRFLVLQNDEKSRLPIGNVNRSSICFSTTHEVGCLSKVLSIFAFYNINLTKIQSMPILGEEWHYLFYVDLEFDDYVRYRQALDAITPLTKKLELLGEYPKGKLIEE